MHGRASTREVFVGLVTFAALAGVVALLALAGGGPSFLARVRTFDVIFRDGQGLREGSAVRIAGIDAGRVVEIDLIEYEGSLRARVRVAVPAPLAKKLRQDVKVTIQPNLTGNSRVNIVSSGRSTVPLALDQVVLGVESTFFDPILEQVGLGPVERSHLSHTIAEVRKTVDTAGPRVREIVTTLQETAAGVRESADAVRPALESTATHVEDLVKRIAANGPKIEATLARLESLSAHADGLIGENRDALQATLASVRDLTATLQDATAKNRVKVERLLDGVEITRARTDRLLYQADRIAGQGLEMMTRNRASMERTISNVKDATDWADKLVQKIYANPFVLSPFYKPTPEDTRVQVVYDTAQVFTKGAQELNDLVKTLEAMKARPQTPEQRQDVAALEQNIRAVTERLGQTSQLLAEALKRPAVPGRTRRQ
jgi:phospholipid/cholesterol/gamma-HCH transport system substrate-binding protein